MSLRTFATPARRSWLTQLGPEEVGAGGGTDPDNKGGGFEGSGGCAESGDVIGPEAPGWKSEGNS